MNRFSTPPHRRPAPTSPPPGPRAGGAFANSDGSDESRLCLAILRDDVETARELVLRDKTLLEAPLLLHTRVPECPLSCALRRKCSLTMISVLANKGGCGAETFGDKASSALWLLIDDGTPHKVLPFYTDSEMLRRVSLLLKAGANSDERNKNGRLIADVFEEQGYPRCALLLRHWHMLVPITLLRASYNSCNHPDASPLLALPESAMRLICLQVAPSVF